MPDLKKTEEVVKFKEGQKVFVPKQTFAFDTELVEVFNVFQDDGSEALLLVNKETFLKILLKLNQNPYVRNVFSKIWAP